MVARPAQIVALVLIVLSLIFAIADRSILQPMYLLVLALVVMYGTNTKFPLGVMPNRYFFPSLSRFRTSLAEQVAAA